MRFYIKLLLLSIFLFYTPLIAIAVPHNNAKNMSVSTDYTSQMIGHYYYCKIFITDCNIKTERPSPLLMNDTLWQELKSVNASTNQSIKYITDQKAHNVKEFWSYPSTHGYSEDYALKKRLLLMDKGWPVSNLLLTIIIDESCKAQALLTITTTTGDFILDYWHDQILPWNETNYVYYKRQAAEHSGRWNNIYGTGTSKAKCVPVA